jgi:hypothetical protein
LLLWKSGIRPIVASESLGGKSAQKFLNVTERLLGGGTRINAHTWGLGAFRFM